MNNKISYAVCNWSWASSLETSHNVSVELWMENCLLSEAPIECWVRFIIFEYQNIIHLDLNLAYFKLFFIYVKFSYFVRNYKGFLNERLWFWCRNSDAVLKQDEKFTAMLGSLCSFIYALSIQAQDTVEWGSVDGAGASSKRRGVQTKYSLDKQEVNKCYQKGRIGSSSKHQHTARHCICRL